MRRQFSGQNGEGLWDKIVIRGYVGNSAEICLQKLLVMAKGNVQVAQQGIAFIDEIDKLDRMDERVNQSSGGTSINMHTELLKL